MASSEQMPVTQTVGALLLDPSGKVLLGLRSPWKKACPSHWDTIGGHVEDGESLDDTLVRELKEEIGVKPTEFRLIATVRANQPQSEKDVLHHVYCVTKWVGGEPANVCDEHSELRWFNLDEMAGLTNIADREYLRYARLIVDGERQMPTLADNP